MDKSVARLNIAHYKKLLASETDATRRESIVRLLAEEEAKLAKISKVKKRKRDLGLFDPFAPVCRAHVDLLLRFGIHPAAWNLTAGEDEHMRLVFVNDGEFKITVQ